eukprot:PhM_4_TR4496/c0_g1_i1/m.61824
MIMTGLPSTLCCSSECSLVDMMSTSGSPDRSSSRSAIGAAEVIINKKQQCHHHHHHHDGDDDDDDDERASCRHSLCCAEASPSASSSSASSTTSSVDEEYTCTSTTSSADVVLPPLRCVLFDLDGVITRTAEMHSRAWGLTFNAVLQEVSSNTSGPAPRPFTQADYLTYLDGKPRYDGARCFLRSRDVLHLFPEGDPRDPPTLLTLHGIGNRKNETFVAMIEHEGVRTYQSTVDLLHACLEKEGMLVGVVSSSMNCRAVLRQLGMETAVHTIVDGVRARELGLAGKPSPDTYAYAAAQLGASPAESVVLEDAATGVQSGVVGGFGLVVGLARHECNVTRLEECGADVVLRDLAGRGLSDLVRWHRTAVDKKKGEEGETD